MNISVILPVLDEARILPETLERLSGLNPFEIIVIDGGSHDGSVEIARCYTPLVWVESPGRGRQMNAGALRATGEILLFLHADVSVQPEGVEELRTLMAESKRVVGGAFRLSVDSKRFGVRMVAAAANLRASLGLPYGDQGIFVRREVFQRLGGYPDIPLMEEIAFVRRLRREGELRILKSRITVSARRWEAEGVFCATLRNWFLVILYLIGIPPLRLVRWYKHVR